MNNAKSEVAVLLDGKKYVMRPTYLTMDAIETDLDMSVAEFSTLLFSTNGLGVRLRHVAIIIHYGIEGHKEDTSPGVEKIGNTVLGAGVGSVSSSVTSFISNAMSPNNSSAEEDMKVGNLDVGK